MDCEFYSTRTRRGSSAFLALLCALGTLATAASAGDLNPPAGPVAPTPGPEPRIPINDTNTPGNVISLFRISQPGSYYLTGNITGVADKHGIEIAADNVTLDLMGFTVQGVPGSDTGIVSTGERFNLTIRNGVVAGWGMSGVSLNLTTEESGRLIENIHARSNGDSGIATGRRAIVRHCTASSNGVNGFSGLPDCQFESCIAEGNTVHGFSLAANGLARGCTTTGNVQDGISASGNDARILDCIASGNGDDGIVCSGTAIVSGCVCSANTGDGIQASVDAEIVSNACRGNGAGAGDGAGIHVTGGGCAIQRNAVHGNDRGIDVDGGPNVIIGNTAQGNTTEYAIVAGNGVGPIINAAGVAANTNPGANFDL